MNIRDFSLNLQKLFNEMGETFSRYQQQTGLTCPSDCGHCCTNPQVEASVHEMIPMALKILDEGKLEEWVDRLQTSEQDHCLVYIQNGPNGRGKCGQYETRPSLCRMFGVAGYLNKHQSVTLSICKTIKEIHPHSVSPEDAPIMAHWSNRMVSLDPQLIRDRLPINQALLRALEKVSLYSMLQERE